jgi:hypothetical protein
MHSTAQYLWLYLLAGFALPIIAQLEPRADVANSCKSFRRSLQHAEPILPKMGKRGGEAVKWYLAHWNDEVLSEADMIRNQTIPNALNAIFGWQLDPHLTTKTKYYKWVAEALPSGWPQRYGR